MQSRSKTRGNPSVTIKAIFFDVGGTLLDETRMWTEWADYMQVPRATFFAALRSIIQRGQHHRRVFALLRPGFDFEAARREQAAAGTLYRAAADDFYPDAVPCLTTLRDRGYFVGVAGNQPKPSSASSLLSMFQRTSSRHRRDGASRSRLQPSSQGSSRPPRARPPPTRSLMWATTSTTIFCRRSPLD